MSSASTRSILSHLHHQIPSKPSPPTASGGISQLLSHHPNPTPLSPCLSPLRRAYFSSQTPRIFQNPAKDLSPQPNLLYRCFSFMASELGSKVNGSLAKNVVKNRIMGLSQEPNLLPSRSFLGFRHFSLKGSDLGRNVAKNPTIALRDAIWKRNILVLVGAVGVLFGIANMFVHFVGFSEGTANYEFHVGFSEGTANYEFLALSSAIAVFAGLYLCTRSTINPDEVYRMAMRRLNADAGILEAMGAPLSGTDQMIYVRSRAGITLKNFKPAFRHKKCFLLFPIQGSERGGLVSVGFRKKKDQYDIKLLAVDVRTWLNHKKMFLIGDEEEAKNHTVFPGLLLPLRVLKPTAAAAKEFEDHDEKEDKEDAERELEEAERKHQEGRSIEK